MVSYVYLYGVSVPLRCTGSMVSAFLLATNVLPEHISTVRVALPLFLALMEKYGTNLLPNAFATPVHFGTAINVSNAAVVKSTKIPVVSVPKACSGT